MSLASTASYFKDKISKTNRSLARNDICLARQDLCQVFFEFDKLTCSAERASTNAQEVTACPFCVASEALDLPADALLSEHSISETAVVAKSIT